MPGANPASPHTGLSLWAFEEEAASTVGTMLDVVVKDTGHAALHH